MGIDTERVEELVLTKYPLSVLITLIKLLKGDPIIGEDIALGMMGEEIAGVDPFVLLLFSVLLLLVEDISIKLLASFVSSPLLLLLFPLLLALLFPEEFFIVSELVERELVLLLLVVPTSC